MKYLQSINKASSHHTFFQDKSILVFNQMFQMNGVLFSYKSLPFYTESRHFFEPIRLDLFMEGKRPIDTTLLIR